MECNKDEALRAKEIAEKKFFERDFTGAKKFSLKAQNLFPTLEGVGQLIATFDVYLASEDKVYGEKDWYDILGVSASVDEEAVKKQYRKLALLLHPDKNKSVGAEGAFKLISEAWSVLSDKSRRMLYDRKRGGSSKGFMQKTSQPNKSETAPRNVNGFSKFSNTVTSRSHTSTSSTTMTRPPVHHSAQPPMPETFWTSCNRCKVQYEYHRIYLNRTLLCPNCNEPFLAKETQSPSSGCGSSVSVSQLHQPNSNQNLASKNSYGLGSRNSTIPSRRVSRLPNGANFDTFNTKKFQQGSFSRTAGVASITTSAAAAAQAADVVHQTYEKVRNEREEAQAVARKEKALRRKNNTLKRKATASGIFSSGLNDSLPSKKERVISDNPVNDNATASTQQCTSPETNRMSGNFGDLQKFKVVGPQSNFTRDSSRLDTRNMLIEMSKLAIDKKLKKWKSAAGDKLDAKEVTKKKQKLRENDKEKVSNVVHGYATAQSYLAESVNSTHTTQLSKEKKSSKLPAKDSDNENNEPVSIDVPDSDFHDFDNDRSERSFGSDEIWATYDDEDGMPRYYALVQKVISLKPFKIRMSYLTSKSNSEFGPLNWVASGFPKSCGDFRIGRYEVSDTINIFSHKVRSEKRPRGGIKIVPRKSETWALYKNWSREWNEHTPDDTIYKYDMVEVLEDYNEEKGVSVIPLVKVPGFRTVFCRHLDRKKVKKIEKEEMFRFSHQVPSYILTGEEAENAPKGYFELDPAATPLELLQIINDRKIEVAAEDMEQTVN